MGHIVRVVCGFTLLGACGGGKAQEGEAEAEGETPGPDCSANGECNAGCKLGTDPDCKKTATCGQDGTCDASCAKGKDPDCEKKTASCVEDGVCEKSCVAGTDPDCVKMADCSADKICNPECKSDADPDCAEAAVVEALQAPSFQGASGTAESKSFRLSGSLGGIQTDAQGKTYRLQLGR